MFNDISKRKTFFTRSSNQANADSFGLSRGQGGVCILWSSNITGISPLNECIHDRICGIRVQNRKGAIFNIYCVYMPSRGCEGDLATSLDELSGIIENTETGSNSIVCGDFNGDMGVLGGERGFKNCTKEGRLVYNFMVKHDLWAANLTSSATGPVNTFYGPNGESCIDYILVPNVLKGFTQECITMENEPLNVSDHYPVTCTFKLGSVECNTIIIESSGSIKWNKMRPEKLAHDYTLPVDIKIRDLVDSLMEKQPTSALIDEAFDRIETILISHDHVIPRSKTSSHLKPYWCPALKALKKEKVKRFKEWCNVGRPRDKDNPFRIANIKAKKSFAKELKSIARSYDDEVICKASRDSEIDRNSFWRLLRRVRDNGKVSISAIKNKSGKVVHDFNEILEVWKNHFSSLCTPRSLPHYDEEHRESVCIAVNEWAELSDNDPFSNDIFTKSEIQNAIKKLNSGKSPGYDGIMKEHLVAAGECIVDFLFLILSWINMIEYIPMNFRRGTRVPLYKGKNTSPLDPNNYRGITLLTTFNKIFEILLWSRIEKWWVENNAVAETQGACKKGVSSVHTAILLQETVTSNLENGHLVFVAYLDVSKAFDRVWVEGLFYQLRKIGIKGKTWRLLFKCYKGFLCRVRLHGKYSNWYEMKCGIHQGGYLSLVKYTAFINSLLTILKASDLCCNILHFKTSPLGYADDIAAACTSKHKIDQVLNIVNTHSSKWRYDLNAKKSAVMVYGEESTINKRNMGYRNYRLGSESVPEKTSYDHVGIKTCNGHNYNIRTEEKIGKARRALSAASSLGIKKGGISMRACNIIFWCLIVPILTYGSELWVLKQSDIDELDKFQRYAGRRFQRFPKWSPNETSCKGLGWMRLETYIYMPRN